jgi:diguanylate cyclase (GGDEF) domain
MRWSEKHSKPSLLILGFTFIGLLGAVDYLTGFELSLGVFYLLPIALVAWFVSNRAGLVASVVSAITWFLADKLAGETLSHPLIAYWNAISRLCFFVVVALLLTRLKAVLENEKDSARTDHLTGAANVRAFYEITEDEITRARRYGHPFTVIYMDADNFKAVNDRSGHLIGNALLRRVVDTIKSNLRASDSVARLGGDEFGVLLPETGRESAQIVVRKMQEQLVREMQNQGWPVTFSIGVLTCVEPPSTVEELIKLADDSMYEVKSSGKNGIKHEVVGYKSRVQDMRSRIVEP